MLRVNSRNTNYNGQSMVSDVIVANFSANINERSNNAYFNVSIENASLAKSNLNVIEGDFTDFMVEVLGNVTIEEEE